MPTPAPPRTFQDEAEVRAFVAGFRRRVVLAAVVVAVLAPAVWTVYCWCQALPATLGLLVGLGLAVRSYRSLVGRFEAAGIDVRRVRAR